MACERSLAAHVRLAVAMGADLRDGETVLGWEDDDDGHRIVTDEGDYTAAGVVVTAGAWSPGWRRPLAGLIRPERQVVGWFHPLEPELFVPERMPCWILDGPLGHFYGLPVHEVPGLKLARMAHEEEVPLDAPVRAPTADDVAELRAVLRRHFPRADGPVATLATCIFESTPDRDFIIDRLPDALAELGGGRLQRARLQVLRRGGGSDCGACGRRGAVPRRERVPAWVASRRGPGPEPPVDAAEGLDDYLAYLRFASVSADPAHATDMVDCARWLAAWLADAGLASEVVDTGGPPAVIAATPRRHARRVLLYGHYDVQPEDPAGAWTRPPFAPHVSDGVVTARGATDNKGQTMSLLLGVRRLMAAGALPVDVVVLVEGEEEIGSPQLADLLRDRRAQLAADVAVVADTSMVEPGAPSITLGLRGIAVLELEVSGPASDLHSGQYGGAVANPATVLARLIGGLHDADGRVAVPGFYDAVREPSAQERSAWRRLAYGDIELLAATGAPRLAGESGWSALERVWARPTAEVNGLTAGHQGDGSKTIVPATATAKLSFRLVADQDPEHVAALVERHLRDPPPRRARERALRSRRAAPTCSTRRPLSWVPRLAQCARSPAARRPWCARACRYRSSRASGTCSASTRC